MKKCKMNPHNAVKSGSSQPILTQSSMNKALTPHIFSQKNLEDKVVKFVVKDEMPFRVVEGAGFVEMMKEAQPRFKIPNRKKIASLVWDLYAAEVAKIKSIIGDQRISITTDIWTSIQNINYMVITAHFLDNDWKLHKRIINFTKITSHKGDDIGKVLETCLSDWGIDKVFTITVDNASTNDKAVEYMGKRLKNCLMDLYHAYKGNSPLDHINGIDDGDVDKDLMEMYKNDPVKLNYHMKMSQVRKTQKQAEIANESTSRILL